MKKYMIKLNGKVYEVEIEEVTETSVLPTQQETVKGEGEPVLAPLPGNVLDIKVVKGDRVKRGQVLAILEAMKMENEILAPVDGVISTIAVTKGENIETGALMMHIG